MSYAIRRCYSRSREETPTRRVKARGLPLEEAQRWCQDPETSSKTCKKAHNRRHTALYGPWFDSYEEE